MKSFGGRVRFAASSARHMAKKDDIWACLGLWAASGTDFGAKSTTFGPDLADDAAFSPTVYQTKL